VYLYQSNIALFDKGAAITKLLSTERFEVKVSMGSFIENSSYRSPDGAKMSIE